MFIKELEIEQRCNKGKDILNKDFYRVRIPGRERERERERDLASGRKGKNKGHKGIEKGRA